MKVINIHTRTINQSIHQVELLFRTMSSKNDLMLATDHWPPMILDHGLQVGSKGGHGPIKYTVAKCIPDRLIEFNFTEPKGFNGYHRFEICVLSSNSTLLKHTIEMDTTGYATLQWLFVIRWLHDAFIEDAFDKVENYNAIIQKRTEWMRWVRVLRKLWKPKSSGGPY